MKTLPAALMLLILGSTATAQEKNVRTPPPDAELDRKLGEGAKEEPGGVTGEMVIPGGPVTNHAGIATALANHAGFVVSTRPARLAPGQSGKLIVVLSLQGDAVVMPGGGLSLKYPPDQGPLNLGPWSVMPPKPGRIYPLFRDRPLHETFMQIELPITVAEGAPYNQYQIHLDLELEVISGMSGTSLGLKKGTVLHQVVIGNPIPTPVPRAPSVQEDTEETQVASGPPVVMPPGVDATGAKGGEVLPSEARSAGTGPDGAKAPTTDPGEPHGKAPRSDDHLLMFGVLGALLLGMIVMLFARGRR